MFRGRVHDVGQVGSLVKIPQGTIDLIAAVTMIGIAELAGPLVPSFAPQQGDRWIRCELLGELDTAGSFHRGVSYYPAIDDDVHFLTDAEIAAIFPAANTERIPVGTLSTSRSCEVSLDVSKLVMRHSAVVGSTGTGKSSTVARFLQALVATGYEAANIVVIDVHGEYRHALGTSAAVSSVLDPAGLFVPYWALAFDSIMDVYTPGADKNAIIKNRMHELIVQERRAFTEESKWTGLSAADVSVDTPIPFDIRKVWFQLDFENHATYPQANNAGAPCVTQPGSADDLRSTLFENYAQGGGSPFKGKQHGNYGIFPDRLRNRLNDPRFRFLSRDWPDASAADPLPVLVATWLGRECPVSILDFSGVPQEATDAAVGVILKLLLDLAINAPANEGIGRARPLLVVLEEAHRYICKAPGSAASLAKEAAETIAREGRKYGVGIMIVSQRPSELSETVLSQCGTVIALRLTNQSDQGTVKSVLPDSVASLSEALPALRNGEALITGEAIRLPARVQITRPSPEPFAADPSVSSWKGQPSVNDVQSTVARLRR
jgi:DNA helicase HerA-like ATPase